MDWGAWQCCIMSADMAAYIGTREETIEDRPEKAALRQADRITHEADQTPEGDVWQTVFPRGHAVTDLCCVHGLSPSLLKSIVDMGEA